MQVEFNRALAALENGKMVRRSAWEKGMFVFRQVPAQIGKDIVPKMQSLPNSVKQEFERRFKEEQIDAIYYDDQFAIVNSSNMIRGYSPSIEDLRNEDWEVLG